MKKSYQLLLTLGVAAASLTSCSRSNYAVNQYTPAYLSSEQTVATPNQADLETTARVTVPVTPSTAPAEVQTVVRAVTARPAKQVAAAKATRPSVAQRVIVTKLAKQLAKIQRKQQNISNVEQTAASKTGRAAIIALGGLLLLLIGGAANVGIIAFIGLIAFLVGLVLVVVHLVSGD